MMKKNYLLAFALFMGTCCTPAFANGLMVCEKGICAQQLLNSNTSSFLNAIKKLLQSNPNGRIDFCDADPHTRQCVNNAVYWQATTDTELFTMALPNARVDITDKDIFLDYLLVANNAYPRCTFSPIELSALPDRRMRIVSSAYNCDLMETEPTNMQKTFLIDFIDVDSRVLGGTYQIQTGGALRGEQVGYALMQFRDTNSPLPLVPPKYSNVAPKLPQVATEPTSEDLFAEQQGWWDAVKVDWNRACAAIQPPVIDHPVVLEPNALKPEPVFIAPPAEPKEEPVAEPKTEPVTEQKPEPTAETDEIKTLVDVTKSQTADAAEPTDLSLFADPVYVAPPVEPQIASGKQKTPAEDELIEINITPLPSASKPASDEKVQIESSVVPPQEMVAIPVPPEQPATCPVYPCAPAEDDSDKPWYSSIKQAFMSVLYLDPIK